MDWAGWAVFGLVATTALTAVMIAAQLAGLTRLDLPLVLGTLVTADPDRARVAGFFIHLIAGQGFALAGSLAVSLGCTPELTVDPGRPTPVTIVPGRPVILVLAVAQHEPLIHVNPAAAWDLLLGDETRWRAWTAESTSRCPSASPSCAVC